MIPNNYYPVKFDKFLRIKSMGEYVVMYALLDDRIHFEVAVENAVYVSQKFLIDVKEEIKQKADNFDGDSIDMFLKMTLTNTTFYRYYPTKEMIKSIKAIKLHEKIKITKVKKGIYNKDDVKIIETDKYMKAVDGDDIVLFGEKE